MHALAWVHVIPAINESVKLSHLFVMAVIIMNSFLCPFFFHFLYFFVVALFLQTVGTLQNLEKQSCLELPKRNV